MPGSLLCAFAFTIAGSSLQYLIRVLFPYNRVSLNSYPTIPLPVVGSTIHCGTKENFLSIRVYFPPIAQTAIRDYYAWTNRCFYTRIMQRVSWFSYSCYYSLQAELKTANLSPIPCSPLLSFYDMNLSVFYCLLIFKNKLDFPSILNFRLKLR